MPEGLYALAVLACPVGMGAMMWMMMRGNHKSEPADTDTAGKRAGLAAPQAEIDQLPIEQSQAARRDLSGTIGRASRWASGSSRSR